MSEKLVYSSPINLLPPKIAEKFTSVLSKKFQKFAKALAIIGFTLIVFSYGPSIWYLAQSGGQNLVSGFLARTAKDGSLDTSRPVKTSTDYQPRFDPALPIGNSISIPSIGVNTPIQEATYDNYEEALKKGVWRVSDFGAPGQPKPIILAAHRYGYLAWTNVYRRQNSFFNLPKLKVGDTVEIVWHQRKYIYEVYAEEKGEQITDYSADLILYTCEDLTGKDRIFRYARLLEI